MADENFLRTYTLKCGAMNKSGFETGNTEDAKQTVLHISFNVEKSDSESSNTAKVQIWNLSEENLKILDTKDCIVELKAGYGNNNALILAGNITAVTTVLDNADKMTEIEVVDGRVALRDTYMSLSYNGSVDCKTIYQEIAKQMGISIIFANDLSFSILPNGFSFVGKARDGLQKVSDCCGHSWTIQNQVLQITWPGRPIESRGYLLSADTGLLGIPKRITIGSDSSNEESKTGWEIEYLLNGAINVNDVIELRSSAVNGYYRVHKVTLDGDNLEGDWMCTAQLLEVKSMPELDVKSLQ